MSDVVYSDSSTGKAFLTPEGWMLGFGKTVPSATAGFAPGSLFVHSDGSGDNDILYTNTGSKASCTFSRVTPGASPTLTSPTFSTSATSVMYETTAGAAAAAVALRFGDSDNKGLEIKVIDEDVTLGGTAETDLTEDVPDGAVILSVQANLETTITATTAVKVGIGVASGDQDAYGLSADLVKNTKIDTIPDWAVLSGAEDVVVTACDTNGDSAGTLDTGTVRVKIVYAVPNSLEDAA